MKLKNLFTSGKMNKDLDERLVPKGEYRDALNVRIANSAGSNVGAVENSLSNVQKSALDFGAGAKCIGAADDDEANRVYWFVKSDAGSYIAEFDSISNQASFVLQDTRSNSILNFQTSHMIQANVLTDADNEKKFLYFTDGINPPRRINIQTAKGYGQNGFEEEDISVIVKPPLHAPDIELKRDSDSANRIKESFIRFAYRYKYNDGEYSALSPLSEVAFSPKAFKFFYNSGVNYGMENFYNSVDVYFDTGSKLVTDIEVVFKEDGNNNAYIIDSLNKKNKKYSDNTSISINFRNNKIYKVLPERQLFRLYDNVPLRAYAQDFIDNRIAYGNYVENYDLINCDQEKVEADMALSVIENEGPGFTMKSDRDYEVGISYLDDYGRSSTIITSENNSVHVPISKSNKSNLLNLKISHIAPLFSKFYKIFIKQSKSDYDSIYSPVFYKDIDYVYLLISSDDALKISGKKHIYIKSDTSGLRDVSNKTEIISITEEDANFLHRGSTPPTVTENFPGTYIKIANDSLLSFDESSYFKVDDGFEHNDISRYNTNELNISGGFSPALGPNRTRIETSTIANSTENSIFYPLSEVSSSKMSVNTSNSVYTTSKNKRWEIEIVETSGSVDKIRWRSKASGFEVKNTEVFNDTGTLDFTNPIAISSSMTLTDSEGDAINVQFSSLTGHDKGDLYIVVMRGTNCFYDGPGQFNNSAINLVNHAFVGFEQTENAAHGSKIGPGSEFRIHIKETDANGDVRSLGLVQGFANRFYKNLEEFIFQNAAGEEESLFNQITSILGDEDNGSNLFHFRRGTVSRSAVSGEEFDTISFTTNSSDPLVMVIQSLSRSGSSIGREVQLSAKMKGTVKYQGDNKIILETEAEKVTEDVFYELPGTYEVNACGYHLGLGGDITQTTDRPAVISLKTFNAYSWGNGIESSKIRDSFNSPSISINTKPLSTIQDYRENHRVSSITYSDVYEQSTNYNGLNEFNLSQINYKDVDDEYGDIRRIHSRDTDLVVFQENKISKLLVNKSVLFNADGTGNIAQNVNILGQQVPYVGEYGISYNAHSFASWGNRMYFVDDRRSAVMRLSQDGLTEISQFGMRDWFKDEIKSKDFKNIIGGYDPYTGQYVTSIKDPLVAWLPEEYLCPRCFCGMDGYIYATSALPTTTTTTAATTTTTTIGSGVVASTCGQIVFEVTQGSATFQVPLCLADEKKSNSTFTLNSSNPRALIHCMHYEDGQTVEDFKVSASDDAEYRMIHGGSCGEECETQWALRGSISGAAWIWWDCETQQNHERTVVEVGTYIVVNSIFMPEEVNGNDIDAISLQNAQMMNPNPLDGLIQVDY